MTYCPECGKEEPEVLFFWRKRMEKCPPRFYVSLFRNVADLIEEGKMDDVNWKFVSKVAGEKSVKKES